MSLLASIALAASGTAALPACSWDRPGVNPFMGDVVAAVDRYKDIPAPVRAKLKARMQKRDYDEVVTIQRDGIAGKAQYSSEIRDMHFGAGSVCGSVTRAKWTQKMEERGLVYCEEGQCILVPTVCRNVSRISRIAPAAAAQIASSTREGDDPQAQLNMDPTSAGPLVADAPGAGPSSFAQQSGGGFDGGAPAAPGGFTGGNAGPSNIGLGVPSLPPGTIVNDVPPPIVVTPPVLPPTGNPGLPPVAPAVPEPQTWALMLAGLGALVAFARRRKSRD